MLAQLPRSCGAPSLEALKARLDGVLGSLSWWGAALHMAEFRTGWAFRSLQHKSFCDPTILYSYEYPASQMLCGSPPLFPDLFTLAVTHLHQLGLLA